MTGRDWICGAGIGLALVSGLSALAVLLLPLLLVLLMLLFDTTAHGVAVLLGLVLHWLRTFVLGDQAAAPALQALALHPLDVAMSSLLRGAPCLAGLMLILCNRKPGAGWWWVVLFWTVAAAAGGGIVTAMLLPGLLSAALFALHPILARRPAGLR